MNFWNDDNTQLLITLWNDGVSASEIGRQLGCYRNAVIGKVHRLRALGTVLRTTGPSTRTERPSRVRRRGERRVKMPAMPPEVPVETIKKKSKPVASVGCTLGDLTVGNCHWPLWADDASRPDFRYCGNAAVTGLPYCAGHSAMSVRRAHRRRRGGVSSSWREVTRGSIVGKFYDHEIE